jgi:hypothetical protein
VLAALTQDSVPDAADFGEYVRGHPPAILQRPGIGDAENQ